MVKMVKMVRMVKMVKVESGAFRECAVESFEEVDAAHVAKRVAVVHHDSPLPSPGFLEYSPESRVGMTVREAVRTSWAFTV